MLRKIILLFLLAVSGAVAFDCQQIPDSEIFAGNNVTIPGGEPVPIPPRYNCTYLIKVPTNSTDGLWAKVTLWNGLKGQNDQFTITEMTGARSYVNSPNFDDPIDKLYYYVIPGANMSVQVITKSVLMNSMFSITVEYNSAKIRAPMKLKTDGEMNFIDTSTFRDNSSLFSAVTFSASEPIAYTRVDLPSSDFRNSYVVDGTMSNIRSITWMDPCSWVSSSTISITSNFITIVTFSDNPVGFVFNLASDVTPFDSFSVMSLPSWTAGMPREIMTEADEYINFSHSYSNDKYGIVLYDLAILTENCTASVLAGPPNNSSQVLLDISTNPKETIFHFDSRYITVISYYCSLYYDIRPWDCRYDPC